MGTLEFVESAFQVIGHEGPLIGVHCAPQRLVQRLVFDKPVALTVCTREFFHGKSAAFFKSVKWIFLVLVFVVPVVLLVIALSAQVSALFLLAFLTQYLGLIAERWFFFAQAKHPQNLYYQAIS